MEKIFWLDNDKGTGIGGFFVKNPLCEFFEKLEADCKIPIGIIYNGTDNLEIIVKDKTINNSFEQELVDSVKILIK